MTTEDTWKFDERATTQAQAVFGSDIAKSAYIPQKAKTIEPNEPDEKPNIYLAGPVEEVLIELTNGKWLMVWTSEWGGIEQYNPAIFPKMSDR